MVPRHPPSAIDHGILDVCGMESEGEVMGSDPQSYLLDLHEKNLTQLFDEEFELLDREFINEMVYLGKAGCRQHDDDTWKEPTRPKRSPVNHMAGHLWQYTSGHKHDLGDRRYHLVAIAYNAMMEFYWMTRETDAQQDKD